MNKKENDDYLVLFQGAKVPKREANKVGVGIVFGLLGTVVTHFLPMDYPGSIHLSCFLHVVIQKNTAYINSQIKL